MSKLIGIVAVARNLAIGRGGALPWHYSSDLKFFKKTTSGNAVVMGRATFESIGKPLPNRVNIVLSRTLAGCDGALVASSVDAVAQLAYKLECDVFVIGGARSYAEFSDLIDEWFVTEIPVEVADADTFMPADFLDGFVERETIALDEGLVVKVFEKRAEAV